MVAATAGSGVGFHVGSAAAAARNVCPSSGLPARDISYSLTGVDAPLLCGAAAASFFVAASVAAALAASCCGVTLGAAPRALPPPHAASAHAAARVMMVNFMVPFG